MQSGSKSKSLVISSQFLRFMSVLLHFVKFTRILGIDGILAKLYRNVSRTLHHASTNIIYRVAGNVHKLVENCGKTFVDCFQVLANNEES